MIKKLTIIAFSFVITCFLMSCSLSEDKKDWVIKESYRIEKVYPIKDIESIINEFPDGYRLYQSYETDGFSYEMRTKMLPSSNLSGDAEIKESGNKEKYDVIFENGNFKTDSESLNNCDVFGKFLFQELTLNKDVLSKLKIHRWSYDEMTGSYFVEYEIQNPIINNFFEKNSSQEAILYVGSISKPEDEYYYSVAISYDDGMNYMERIEAEVD